MWRWLLLLGGPLIWTAHFGLIYAISSISVQATGETTSLARALIIGSAVVAELLLVSVVVGAWRLSSEGALGVFWKNVSALGALIAAIAIVWQSLPAMAPI